MVVECGAHTGQLGPRDTTTDDDAGGEETKRSDLACACGRTRAGI